MNALRTESIQPIHINLGQQFGNYRLERLLGQGGFATIYLGKHQYLGTRAAVKILDTRLTREGMQKFHTEARIAARLVHSHIVRVLDFGLQNNIPYLVMDYAPNGTLRQLHPEGQVLPLFVVLKYMRQIADGLQYIHDRGLIHQDLKPENLLLGRKNEVLISDFGIAITEYQVNMLIKKKVVGTVPYMAPEQIRGNPCFASDQYALAVIIYEWLCGELPFHGSPLEIARKHLQFSPPSMRIKVPTIPPAVEDVVMQALAKQPEQRFSNVQAFALALEEACNYLPTPILRNHQSTLPKKSAVKQAIAPQTSQAEKRRTHSLAKELAIFFVPNLLIEAVVSIILYSLGLLIQAPWFLLTLCLVSLPLVGTLAIKNWQAFLLASSILIFAALAGLALHSLPLFLLAYTSLLLLSTAAWLSLRMHKP
jgi:serine/threonine protein kinase